MLWWINLFKNDDFRHQAGTCSNIDELNIYDLFNIKCLNCYVNSNIDSLHKQHVYDKLNKNDKWTSSDYDNENEHSSDNELDTEINNNFRNVQSIVLVS